MIFLQLAALSVIIGAEVNGILEPAADEAVAGEAAAQEQSPYVTQPAEPVSFAKALAGVAVLVLLGRGGNGEG